MSPERALPAAAGIGLKPEHYETVLDEANELAWFEVHAENYMGAGGAPHHWLSRVRADYPVTLHGVGLSIGSASGLDAAHLDRLAALERRYEPAVFSEHLAWSSHGPTFLSDLLPVPYSEATLKLVCEHVDQLQERLGRRVLIENPSTYVRFHEDSMGEGVFMTRLCETTGCGLLLDVNNVYVSATNHGRDPHADLAALPVHCTGQIHLAGHTVDEDVPDRPLLIDSHNRPVTDAVWALYEDALRLAGPQPTLIEWDQDLPTFDELAAEAAAANDRLRALVSPAPAHALAR